MTTLLPSHSPSASRARPALIAALLAASWLTAGSVLAQPAVSDVAALTAFQRAADSYAFLHRQVERRIGMSHRRAGEPDAVQTAELAAAIIEERSQIASAPLFTPAVVAAFRQLAAQAVRAPGCDPGELRTGLWEMQHSVHSPATGLHPVGRCIAEALPHLPAELEYRSAGTVLLLVDGHANLVVDVLPALLAGSDIR